MRSKQWEISTIQALVGTNKNKRSNTAYLLFRRDRGRRDRLHHDRGRRDRLHHDRGRRDRLHQNLKETERKQKQRFVSEIKAVGDLYHTSTCRYKQKQTL